jgi:hypothetical protein
MQSEATEYLVCLDARELAKAISRVDGGCIVCVARLTARVQKLDPDRDWAALVAEISRRDVDELREMIGEAWP